MIKRCNSSTYSKSSGNGNVTSVSPLHARLRRFLPRAMPGVFPSFYLCSIRLSASAWWLLVFSCSCHSLSFSAARSRLLRMSSSNRTTQSSDITERLNVLGRSDLPFCSLPECTRNFTVTLFTSSEEEKTFRNRLKSKLIKGQRYALSEKLLRVLGPMMSRLAPIQASLWF